MAKEIIDELNELGEIIGQIDKDIAHKEGRLHKSIHLWIVNDNDEVLLQYRCSDKDLYPDTWDVSVGGHVASLEDTRSAAIREAKEELGLDVLDEELKFITTLREDLLYNDINSREMIDVFLLKKNLALDDIKLQEEEVGSAKFVSIPELFKLMEDDLLLPHYDEYKLMKDLFTELVIKNNIRTIKNYPIDGVNFRDITTLLKNKDAYRFAVDRMLHELKDLDVDVVVGPEARGIMFAAPVAYGLNKGYVPVRKPRKLPGEVVSETYDLEYGTDSLEIHKDAINKGDKVVIIDDLMATGGTMGAIVKLVEKLGGEVVKIMCMVDLPELGGKDKFNDYNYSYIVKYMEDEK
jgi:adenine phosphoribosyltransferase